jgi:acetoacetate decarboxylase
MVDPQGFFYPRTATGRASILPAPPWYYSGDLLTVEFRTQVEIVRSLLPSPLELAPEDPGAVAIIWADWQSCSQSQEELWDPVRSQYRECFVVVRCSYREQTYSRCVYIWVDKDFALARGLHQGYPKKLGSIAMTRPHPYGYAAPRLEAGARFGASLAAGDRRLATARCTLTHESPSNGFVNAHPMAHHRVYHDIALTDSDAFNELIESGAAAVEGGPTLAGTAELEFFESPTEELANLKVVEVLGAYYRQVGVEWNGGRVLERFSPSEQ